MYGDEEEKITIDRKTFKTLASDTRIGILKSLKVRRKTLSELSKEHHMSVSTIKEHLENLVEAGLIVQIDDGHKWKYYELTRKGSAVLNPDEKKVWIMLSLSSVAVLAAGLDAVTGVISRLFSTFALNSARSPQILGGGSDMLNAPVVEKSGEAAAEALPLATAEAGSAMPAAAQAAAPVPWLHIAIIIVFAALAAYFVFRLWGNRKKQD